MVLTDFGDTDYVKTQLVAALDITKVLAAEIDTNTGVLPGDAGAWNTLWHAKTIGGLNLGLYVPSAVRTITLSRDWERGDELRLPWPPLVFVALPGRKPYAFACKTRPVGSATFPEDPALLPAAFFASRFSRAMDTAARKSRRHPADIGQAWAELAGAAAYPLDDLVPALRVRDAMQIGE